MINAYSICLRCKHLEVITERARILKKGEKK